MLGRKNAGGLMDARSSARFGNVTATSVRRARGRHEAPDSVRLGGAPGVEARFGSDGARVAAWLELTSCCRSIL